MKTRLVAATLLLFAGTGISRAPARLRREIPDGQSRYPFPAPCAPSAAILIYANPALNLPRALANVPFDATLRKAGYRPTVVTSADALTARWVGADGISPRDVADSQAVSSRPQGANAPIVLPVMFNATGAELAAAKKQHQRILKAPTKNQSFLDAIDDALPEVSAQAKARG